MRSKSQAAKHLQWLKRAGANNGSLKLTIDGQLKQTLSGKDNDTRQVDYIRLGAVAGIDSSTRGTLYLDDFRSWDPTAVVQAQFRYDGDGRRVQSVVNGVTTAFVGQYFEWTGSTSTMKKYYYFGAQRVAVRDGNGTGTTGLSWLLTDHGNKNRLLSSTTVTLDAAGAKNAEKRYKPWGEIRQVTGEMPTDYQYTGQRKDSSIGMLWYGSRFYDAALGRFSQPDSIVPSVFYPLAFDRYQYVYSNPMRFFDPSGHKACDEYGPNGDCITDSTKNNNISKPLDKSKKSGCIEVCYKIPIGKMHVTWYYIPIESEFNSGQTVEVIVEGKSMLLDREAVTGGAGMIIQGSLKINNNQYINSLKHLNDNTYQASSGLGNLLLKPFQTGAVDRSNTGKTFFLPDFIQTPNKGNFLGVDHGGEIIGNDLDIFIGEGRGDIREALKIYSSQRMKTSGVFGDAGTSDFEAFEVICELKPANPAYVPN